jgi:hypothetical protein
MTNFVQAVCICGCIYNLQYLDVSVWLYGYYIVDILKYILKMDLPLVVSVLVFRVLSPYLEGYKLYYRQMVAQLHTNEEMCIFHSCFHDFVHPLYF